MARPSAAPLKRSRAIARDSTEVEHAPAAWIIRPTRRLVSVLELAHQMLPATNTAKPARTGQRLPYLSEIGPTTSCPRAKIARKTVIADVTAALDTRSAPAICGNEGNRMLVASVPMAARPASTATCEAAAICGHEVPASVLTTPS